MPKQKPSTIKLQVFKGREAKLNKAIFQILALKGPQTIYDIHKTAKAQRGLKNIRYASINKRVRALEESGYIEKTGFKKTKAGFESLVYDLKCKAYLGMLLNFVDMDKLLTQLDEPSAQTILAATMSFVQHL